MAGYFITIELYHKNGRSVWSHRAIDTQNLFLDVEEATAQELEPIIYSEPKPEDYRESHITVLCSSMTELHEPLTAQYMGYGVVRLFREVEGNKSTGTIEVDSDDTTVAIVAVPSYMSPTDLLAFIGEEFLASISHFRLIRTERNSRFMALMKFRSREKARRFQDEFNGIAFNSMESEKCHAIFVKSVIFKPLSTPLTPGIPYLIEDPFTMQMKESKQTALVVKELPTCPVCLERMDSDLTGLLTITCQHTFHCDCLSQWRDDTCPVCRYSNLSVEGLKSAGSNLCTDCGGNSNLWVCLICGNVGCGRYESKHAIQHYESTNHCFSMDITTQRVWDYAGDNYVHRLLQNEADGKLVELASPAGSGASSCTVLGDSKGKSLDYSIEYSNVLLSQLESQREYYESRLKESKYTSNQAIDEKQRTIHTLYEQLNEMKVHTKEAADSTKERINSFEIRVSKAENLKDLVNQFQRKLREEQTISASLVQNIEQLKLENSDMKKQNKDLEEQLNDLMFYLESQEKFKNASDEVRNGTVVIRRGRQTKKSKSGKK